jgi:hypothetical protein
MNLDANLQALFVYVDDALAISISSHPNWSNAQLDAQAMLIFRDYVDRNVTTMMVENGTYYIMYRNQGVADGEGEWVVTPVDETWIEENMGSAPIALPQGSANVPGITPEGAEPGPSVPRNSTNGDLRQSTRDAFNAAENAWNSQLP